MSGKLSQAEQTALYDSQESLRVMSGRYGARVLGATTVRTGLDVKSLQIRENATEFTTLTCTNGNSAEDLDDTFFLGGASAFIAGDTLTAPPGYRFTVITLSAGSVSVTGPNIGS